jgi:hypothetical protein
VTVRRVQFDSSHEPDLAFFDNTTAIIHARLP